VIGPERIRIRTLPIVPERGTAQRFRRRRDESFRPGRRRVSGPLCMDRIGPMTIELDR
jgi:hypothetical protein